MHSWAEVLHEFANGVPDAGRVIPTNEGNDILQSWQQSFLMTDAQQDRHHEHLHRETKKSDPDSPGAIQPRGEERYKWEDLNSKEKKALRARLLGAFVGGSAPRIFQPRSRIR